MADRTRLERRLIEMSRNVLDASEAHDKHAEEMADEIKFARQVLDDWTVFGAKEAFSRALAFLELGERWRTERALADR